MRLSRRQRPAAAGPTEQEDMPPQRVRRREFLDSCQRKTQWKPTIMPLGYQGCAGCYCCGNRRTRAAATRPATVFQLLAAVAKKGPSKRTGGRLTVQPMVPAMTPPSARSAAPALHFGPRNGPAPDLHPLVSRPRPLRTHKTRGAAPAPLRGAAVMGGRHVDVATLRI